MVLLLIELQLDPIQPMTEIIAHLEHCPVLRVGPHLESGHIDNGGAGVDLYLQFRDFFGQGIDLTRLRPDPVSE